MDPVIQTKGALVHIDGVGHTEHCERIDVMTLPLEFVSNVAEQMVA